MGVVEVDDFLPTVVSHGIDDGAMVIRSHTYGEVQETRGRRQNLDNRNVISCILYIPVSFRVLSYLRRARSLSLSSSSLRNLEKNTSESVAFSCLTRRSEINFAQEDFAHHGETFIRRAWRNRGPPVAFANSL